MSPVKRAFWGEPSWADYCAHINTDQSRPMHLGTSVAGARTVFLTQHLDRLSPLIAWALRAVALPPRAPVSPRGWLRPSRKHPASFRSPSARARRTTRDVLTPGPGLLAQLFEEKPNLSTEKCRQEAGNRKVTLRSREVARSRILPSPLCTRLWGFPGGAQGLGGGISLERPPSGRL